MKPRLIDANKTSKIISNLVKPLTTPDGCGARDSEIQAYNEGLIDALESIHEQPTAYSIDKVVEKLEKAAKIYRDKAVIELSTEGHTLDYEHFEGKSKAFLKAIEIVKGGAVDDETMA